MKKNKIFYFQVNFYLMVIAWALAIVALILYSSNCASEFNGGTVSSTVVAWDIVAIVLGGVAIICDIINSFNVNNSILAKVLEYSRVLKYVAFLALLESFLSCILAEYSLLGTILYPIVSGTVGDPVDPILSGSFFSSLIFTLIAFIFALVSGLIQKASYYKMSKMEQEI